MYSHSLLHISYFLTYRIASHIISSSLNFEEPPPPHTPPLFSSSLCGQSFDYLLECLHGKVMIDLQLQEAEKRGKCSKCFRANCYLRNSFVLRVRKHGTFCPFSHQFLIRLWCKCPEVNPGEAYAFLACKTTQ